MKSLKAEPIPHPTKKHLAEILKETEDEFQRVTFCVEHLGLWKHPGRTGTMKVRIPIPNHADSAWQLITYELSSLADYKEAVNRREEISSKINN